MTPSKQIIPYGFCHCGCGEKTKLAKQSDTKLGWIKGYPIKYVVGHATSGLRTTAANRKRVVSLTQHGHSHHGLGASPTYNSWRAMIGRCRNKTNIEYGRYGGSGVKVCERWAKFSNFLRDMGDRPDGKTIDRFPDPAGNYEPSNCRWATPREQNMNTRKRKLINEQIRPADRI